MINYQKKIQIDVHFLENNSVKSLAIFIVFDKLLLLFRKQWFRILSGINDFQQRKISMEHDIKNSENRQIQDFLIRNYHCRINIVALGDKYLNIWFSNPLRT